VLAPFGDPIVFLFIGSFMLARAMMLHRLDHRFALAILSLRWVRGHPARLLGALGLVTAAISMWVSNTATTAMMLPIALGLLHARQGLRTSEGSPLEVRRWPYATGFFSGQPYAQISSPALTATSAPGGNNSWPTRTNAGWRSPSASPPGRCATRSMLNLEGRAAALYWECEGPENRMMMGQEKFLGKFFEGKKEILGEYRIHSQSTLKTQFSGFGGRGCNLCPVAKGIETWMAVGVPMLVVM
jgi:hypothetical protein